MTCIRTTILAAAALAVLAAWRAPSVVDACPFCPSQSQSLSEEMETMDVTAIVELLSVAPMDAPRSEQGTAEFRIVQILQGGGVVPGSRIRSVYFGDAQPGALFLIFGVEPPDISWTTPMSLTPESAGYLRKLVKLPKTPKRLEFFLEQLESDNPLIAQDAYDEFARAPYADVKALKSRMSRPQLLQWIRDPGTPTNRRRLYLTMLGICGQPEDLPMLEKMLESDDRRIKSGLDALIGCYVTLKGAAALPVIEKRFLSNKAAEYSDTYAAIMALRFHGTEGGVVEQQAVAKTLHAMLDRPPLADLVIPDLARWEDWSQMDRLVELFQEADEKSSWLKVPVIQYLRACPLPAAKNHLKRLEQLDPKTFERAQNFLLPRAGAPRGKSAAEQEGV